MFSFTPPPPPNAPSNRRIHLLDTTLRDGLRHPNRLSTRHHNRLLCKLHALHPDIIELTHPRSIKIQPHHPIHSILVPPSTKSISESSKTLSRLPNPLLHVYTPVPQSTPESVINRISALVTHARAVCPDVQYSPKHGAELFLHDPSLLTRVIQTAVTAGARIITLTDTSGECPPRTIREAVRHVSAVVADLPEDVSISLHAHGERDTVLRKVVAGVEAGAGIVECTVSGVGHMPALQDVVSVFEGCTSVREEALPDCVAAFEDCFHLF